MGILDIASGNSIWRGYYYFEEQKVLSFKKISNTLYKGVVSGSSNKQYDNFVRAHLDDDYYHY